MALKLSLLLVSVLIVATVVAPKAEATFGLIRGLLGLIRVQGTLFCTANGNTNGSSPVFPNAIVQLRCGNGTVVGTSITNGQGFYSILLDAIQFILSVVLSNCNLAVTTPLSTCNATLPSSGTLLSPLQVIGRTPPRLLRITTLAPGGFRLV